MFTVIDSYRQKKQTKKNTEVGVNGSHSSGSGTGFSPSFFSWDWDGKRLKFVMHFGNRR